MDNDDDFPKFTDDSMKETASLKGGTGKPEDSTAFCRNRLREEGAVDLTIEGLSSLWMRAGVFNLASVR